MIYLLFMCFCVFAFFSWLDIRRVAKHDGVLFPLCQLRRDIMRFLYENIVENPGALSREEYQSLRRLSSVLDTTIRNYNRHKTLMFDLRKMTKYLSEYRKIQRKAKPLVLTDNKEIQKFHNRFSALSAKAFIAYTPLIRSEFALRVLVLAYRAKHREYVLTVAKQVRDTFENSNAGNTAAAV